MSTDEAIKRWDDFLAKILLRAGELFEPAHRDGLQMFIDSGCDPIPISVSFSGLRAQMLDLCKKVDDTWSEKVSGLFDGADEKVFDRECAKGHRLRDDLEYTFMMIELEVRQQIAMYVSELAKKDLAKPIACTQCLAPLPKPPHLYNGDHLTCKFCATVNTYEPGTYQRMMGMFIADLARWNAREEMKNHWIAENKLHSLRDGAFEKGKQSAKAAKRVYVEKYAAELKKWSPEIDVEKLIASEMRGE